MASDFRALEKKLDGVAAEFDGRARKSRLEAIGKLCEKDVEQAVQGDLGDLSMSGWRRKAPIDVVGHSEISTSVDFGIFVSPAVKGGAWRKGLGLMRVLQDGRKAYSKGDKKDGAVVAKNRKVKRTTGATKGKDTWDDAVKLIDENIGKRIHTGIVQDTLNRYF
jgi:hypothetical protein